MIKKRGRLLFSFLLSIIFVVFFSFNLVKAQDEPLYKIPELQIQIDGIEFSEVDCGISDDGKTSCQVPWIAQYIKGLYQYAISIAGVLAAIVLMAGGIFWLISAGSADRITKAKSLISGSLIGLMILLTSYLVLYEINPNLVIFGPMEMGVVDIIEGDSDDVFIEFDVYKIANRLNIKCKTNNQAYDSLETIAQKTKGRMTYNQELRGQNSLNSTVYIDCSSYAHFLLKCAGINDSVPMFTGSIFSDKIILNKNRSAYKPGDLVGWPPHERNKMSGHVFVHVANGVFYDAHGGTEGRKSGNSVGVYNLEKIIGLADKYNEGLLFINPQ